MKVNPQLKVRTVELIGLGVITAARALYVFFKRQMRQCPLNIYQIYCLYAISKYKGKHMAYMVNRLCTSRTGFRTALEKTPLYVVYTKKEDKRYLYPELTEEGQKFLDKWLKKVLAIEYSLGFMVEDKESFLNFVHIFCSELAKGNRNSVDSD